MSESNYMFGVFAKNECEEPRFTPCQRGHSLLKNFPERQGMPPVGAAVGFFTRRFKLRTFSKLQKFTGASHCAGVKSISGGANAGHPKILGKSAKFAGATLLFAESREGFAAGFFEGKGRSKKLETKPQ